MTVPYVIEKGKNGSEHSYDLYSRLLKDRVIFIKGVFDQSLADSITAQLLFLESQDNEKDIYMYINSPGGEIASMFSIYDTMNYIKPDVCTLAYGRAVSAGSFILAAGAKGKRYILQNSEVMIHELSSGSEGKFHDMEISFNQVKHLYEKMAKYYVKFTGKTLKRIKQDMKKDFYMTADEAVNYGLVDEVQSKRK